jgi:hypothetical protein
MAMTKTIDDINLNTWFIDRELIFCPNHFTDTKVALTSESKTWISEKLHGRYCLQPQRSSLQYPSFEDPKEALFYELTWG